MNAKIFTVFFLIGISTLIPTVLAVSERPDAYSEWDESSTFTTTGTAIARVIDHYINVDSDKYETLMVNIYTERNEENPELKVSLTETGGNTGIFEGTVIFSETSKSFGNTLQVRDGDVVSVEYTYSQVPDSNKHEDKIGVGQEKTIQNSQEESGISNTDEENKGTTNLPYEPSNSENEEKIMWLESSYPATGTGVVRVIDPDMNLNPDEFDNFDVDVWSDSDLAGLDLTLTETNVATGIFEGTVFFSTNDESSGHRLRVAQGDTITAKHQGNALTAQHTTADKLDMVITTALIQGIHDPDNADRRITLDKTTYTWTDKVRITIDSPEHNLDSAKVEEIGNSEQNPVKISTRHFDLDNYKLVETGANTGIFTGVIVLTGFSHDADGNTQTGTDGNDVADIPTSGVGPVDGLLPADNDDGIAVSFEHAEDETAITSALIRWNEGIVQWLESSYPASSRTGVVRVTDQDMNWNPEKPDKFSIDVWSDADASGINLTLTETNNETGIFEGTVFFTTEEIESHDDVLRIIGEDNIYAEYEDNTLPEPYMIEDDFDIVGTSMIQKIPPLSPYKQMVSGTLVHEIACKDNLEKIFRPSGFVACVDSSSIKKLLQWGWSLKPIPVDFTGEWRNIDSATNDIANIVVIQDNSKVIAHAWSSCDPNEFCDWGESSGIVDDNTAMFSWKVNAVTHKVTITKIGNNLQVDRESVSLDPKWTQNKHMDFVSGTLTLDK